MKELTDKQLKGIGREDELTEDQLQIQRGWEEQGDPIEIDSIEENVSGKLQPVGEEILPEHIDNDIATTLCERIASRRNEIMKLHKLANVRVRVLQDKIDQVGDWLGRESKKYEAAIQHFALPLEHYMRAFNKSNPKVKHINLPTGTLKLRKQKDKVELHEGVTLETWSDYPFVWIKPETVVFDKGAALKYVKENGEIPDCFDIIPGEVTFSIETIIDSEVNDA